MKNPLTHLTVKERRYPSFPVKQLVSLDLVRGRVLDFGCGLGVDVRFLTSKGYSVTGYDVHYAPQYPQGKFDTVLCTYVLNVLLPDEQARVLMQVSELLTPDGSAYFTVRRDILRDGFLPNGTYQCHVTLPYKSLLAAEHCEVYEYQNFTRLYPALSNATGFLTESALTVALYHKFPVAEGEALVIPKRSVANYFLLSPEEQLDAWLVVSRVQELLTERYQPDGFTVGMNVGKAAG